MPCPADMHLLLKYIHRSPRPSSVHCCSTGFAVLCTSLPSHCEAPGAARLISLAARNLVTPIRSAHCAAAQHGPALCGAVAMDCPPAWRFPAAAPAEYLGPALAQAAPLLAHPAASWCTLPSPSATAQGRHRHQWAVRPRRRSFRRTCPGDRGVPPCTSVASAMRLPPGLGSSPSRPVFPAGYGHLPLLAYRRHTRSTAALTAIVRLGVGHLRGAPPDRAPPGSDSELP